MVGRLGKGVFVGSFGESSGSCSAGLVVSVFLFLRRGVTISYSACMFGVSRDVV